MGHMPPGYLFQIAGGEDHGKYAGYRYGKDRTEHRKAAEAGGIIGKGPAGCFWFCNAAGYLQVAAGSCPADTG